MAPPARMRNARRAKYSKATVGRAQSSRNKAGQAHKAMDVFDFTDTSEKEEPYEVFDPPLHSTAIYTDEEALSGPSVPSSPQGREAKGNVNTSDSGESENESIKLSAKKKPQRKHKPVTEETESDEPPAQRQAQPVEKTSAPQKTVLERTSSRLPGTPAKPAAADEEGAVSGGSAAEQEARAGGSPSEVRKKIPPSKRKRSKKEDSDNSNHVHAWCLEGQRTSDVTELGVILSVFEDICLTYRQRVESKFFKDTISKFHSNVKEELIKRLKEAQKVKTLKRKNAKIISDIEKKRQHLIDVQDELLCLEPRLKQLQTKYEELMERKAALSDAAYFLTNLKQLQEYSDFQEKRRKLKEQYDSTSLPALLCKAKSLWRADTHLQNINHQLEALLDQE